MSFILIELIGQRLIFEINMLSLIILIILCFLLVQLIRWSLNQTKEFQINEAEIGIGKNKIKIVPNSNDYQIAYKIWVELSTRKVGLAIDEENDVIHEVYKSWYEFFKVCRELIKEIPIVKYQKNKSTQQIVNISLKILNDEMRPHLTKWQAKYQKWLKSQEEADLSPQDLQKKFPEYDKLIAEMLMINRKLVKYKQTLHNLIITEKNGKKI